jgi:hypothetical protein
VFPYQACYLAVHLLNASLAGRLVERVAGLAAGRIACVLFAVNPLFIAPVSNRYFFIFDTLGCTFFLAALLLTTRAARTRSRLASAGSLLLALAAYLSKESYYTFTAVAVQLVGIPAAGERWRMSEVRRHADILVPHAILAAAAWMWRRSIIGGFGGYGFVEIQTASDFAAHVAERAATLSGFAAWSMLPAFSRWTGDEFFPLLFGLPLLLWVTWKARRADSGPGALWCWSWILIAWLPSTIMTTYAPVSFYPVIPAAMLLLAQALKQCPAPTVLVGVFALWNAIYGVLYYANRRPEIDQLKLQEAALASRFAPSGWHASGPRQLVLVEGHPDLMPDAAVKYQAQPGTSLSGILLFNDGTSINWVITDAADPGDVRPLVRSKLFQDGYMEMPPYRAYPLELGSGQLSDHSPNVNVTVLLWQDEQYVEGLLKDADSGG